jgi:hypothetical protein
LAHHHVHHVFRLSAVRRPVRQDSGGARSPVAVHVSDEELVDALWTTREQLQSRLREEAARQLPALGITGVVLEQVQPVGGVRVQLGFTTTRRAGPGATTAALSPAIVATLRDVLGDVLDGPVAVSASPEPADRGVTGPASRGTGWDRVAPWVAAFGTGIGVIGFVTFVGGMIVWARVRAAGIPAAPTLGIFPRQDLLVIGAETLVPMVLQGLVVVAALAAVYALVRIVLKVRIPHLNQRMREHEDAFLAGEASLAVAIGMFLFVAVALWICVALLGDDLTVDQAVPALFGVAVAALVAAAVGSRTRRFLYLATTTFVLVGLFLGFIAYWSAGNQEAIRGAAIIRENQTPVAGIFVAEGAGRVYLARIAVGDDGVIDKSRSRLVGIAKSQVTDIAIADRAAPREAVARAGRLVTELCSLQPASTRPAQTAAGSCPRGPGRSAP